MLADLCICHALVMLDLPRLHSMEMHSTTLCQQHHSRLGVAAPAGD